MSQYRTLDVKLFLNYVLNIKIIDNIIVLTYNADDNLNHILESGGTMK